MNIGELANGIAGFGDWTNADRIRFFTWALHSHGGKESVASAEIASCFDQCHVHRPANLHRALDALCTQRELLKQNGRYKLAALPRAEHERLYGTRPQTTAVHQILTDLVGRVADAEQNAYLAEALVCFKHGAWRAAVIMTWNAAFDHFCQHIARTKLSEFNTAYVATGRKKPAKICARADLQELKESEVIVVARAAGITSKAQHKCLENHLDIRNDAAHPSGAPFNQLKVEAFIDDVVRQVVLGFPT